MAGVALLGSSARGSTGVVASPRASRAPAPVNARCSLTPARLSRAITTGHLEALCAGFEVMAARACLVDTLLRRSILSVGLGLKEVRLIGDIEIKVVLRNHR